MLSIKEMKFRAICRKLEERKVDFQIRVLNGDLHRLIKTNRFNYYYLYKKDYFEKFADIFPEVLTNYEDADNLGDSINVEWWEYCKRNKVDFIVFAHPEETMVLNLLLGKNFLDKIDTTRTHIKKYSKKVGYKKYEEKQEATVSFPLMLLKDWNEHIGEWY